jgi:chemotaxis protein CheY-P-specific phosphatase CheC
MIEDAVHQLLSESAQKTLETMFFAAPDQVSNDSRRPAGELIAARLTFQGAPPGRFGLVVSDLLARTLAGNFIGCDDATRLLPAQVAEVMRELANMMCGSALSELESNANFELGAPESIHVGADKPGPDFAGGSPSVCRFEFSQGALVLFLRFEEPM